MSYYFFIGDLMLPVTPKSIDISINNKNKTVSLINEGEINIIKKQGLKDISFEILLPSSSYPFANYANMLGSTGFVGASEYLKKIAKAKELKTPTRFIVIRLSQSGGVLFNTNFLVTIEDFTTKEDADNGFDIVVPIRLKEYRKYGTKQMLLTKDKDGKDVLTVAKQREAKEIPKTIKITKEKSVFEAVKFATGGSVDWQSVAKLNGITNPTGVQQKDVLKIG